MEFLIEYGLFLAKAVTIVVAILIIIATLFSAGQRGNKSPSGHIEVELINDDYDNYQQTIKDAVLDEDALKKELKQKKKDEKAEKKQRKKQGDKEDDSKKRIYVLDFDGDIKASAVDSLREEITAILTMATSDDEVVVRLESPGGMVHTYGLASSQLDRIIQRDIPLTIAVDAVAASGGYMMACIGKKIIAAPFAVIGSIGVVAQLPNFHRLLKKNDIDFELFTAGEHKRTVTMFGENTDKGKAKFIEDLEETHQLFKEFVSEHRPQVDIANVATGEVWYGKRALEKNLIDEIQTSDEYLMSKREDNQIFSVKYEQKKTLQQKLGVAVEHMTEAVIGKLVQRFGGNRPSL